MTSMMTNNKSLNLPPKLYRISDLVEYAGVTRQTIHNYSRLGLIREAEWTAGGHRLFDESVFYRLERIAALKPTKTMREIRRLLDMSFNEPS